ncbi:hypothetical protein [Amycolatopsis sp. FDAARGOS 1241]|uniref:hypothetical protein n=1 Tax=Amycolatopsis sp. FDAARGOS 1241 TaxID=2778070 RepID=UPI00194E14EF|nr:hypothetical protein [Amycolatopsis sp. FDAARGOS 1241]QRP42758.1 hypothetical protein I6J71_25090 [Amycolatopsis sp. FDAARGOS 1241]
MATTIDPAELPQEELEVALRRYALNAGRGTSAGINLLIDDGSWLRLDEFVRSAIDYIPAQKLAVIDWGRAEKYLPDPRRSPREIAILRFAIALGHDTFDLQSVGPQTGIPLIKAVARAIGQNA